MVAQAVQEQAEKPHGALRRTKRLCKSSGQGQLTQIGKRDIPYQTGIPVQTIPNWVELLTPSGVLRP